MRRSGPIGSEISRRDWVQIAGGFGQFVTAVAAIGALVFTASATRATSDQVRLSEQGQYTDRFGRAVEQLGQEDTADQKKLSIRLGGIYALERLMWDSKRDRPTIVEVLCAFIRTHAQPPQNSRAIA
jgi:hypothetical protein